MKTRNGIVPIIAILVSQLSVFAATAPSQTIKMWETAQWTLESASESANPFDLVAKAVFTHEKSKEEITTDLFYDGENTWRFRFLGSKLGKWSFVTESDDDDLAGYDGDVNVNPPAPGTLGLMGTDGHKFTVPTESGGTLGYLINIYEYGYGREGPDKCLTRMDYYSKSNVKDRFGEYMDKCRENGMEVVQLFMTETHSTWHDHETGNPKLETFEILDTIFTLAAKRGIRIHFWKWGDGGRHTPDEEDKPRIRRYIAARLAPLNGWSMSYGYDLSKDPTRGGDWAGELQGYMGWHHLLWARHWQAPELDAVANDDRNAVAQDPYGHATDLFGRHSRPIVYERRWWKDRDGVTEKVVRRAMWQFALAGGAASWWGELSKNPYPEESLECFRTHYQFWHQNRRFLVGLQPRNSLTDGYCMKAGNTHYIFYKERATSIEMNLSASSGTLKAVAVDTKKEYKEISLEISESEDQTWNAPYESDWAIAVGDFEEKQQTQDLPRTNRRVQSEACGSVHPSIWIDASKGVSIPETRNVEYYSLRGQRLEGNLHRNIGPKKPAMGVCIIKENNALKVP